MLLLLSESEPLLNSWFFSLSLSSLVILRWSSRFLISSKFKGAVCTAGFEGDLISFLRLLAVLETSTVYGKD